MELEDGVHGDDGDGVEELLERAFFDGLLIGRLEQVGSNLIEQAMLKERVGR